MGVYRRLPPTGPSPSPFGQLRQLLGRPRRQVQDTPGASQRGGPGDEYDTDDSFIVHTSEEEEAGEEGGAWRPHAVGVRGARGRWAQS